MWIKRCFQIILKNLHYAESKMLAPVCPPRSMQRSLFYFIFLNLLDWFYHTIIIKASEVKWESPVIKVINSQKPKHLFESINQNAFQERRKPGRLKFFRTANTKTSLSSLKNRLTNTFKEIEFDHFPFISVDSLCTNLKNLFIVTWRVS